MILLSKDYWEIKNTQKKGRGIFAKKDIKPGVLIGDYIGKVIKTAEEDIYEKDENLYLMYYHDYASIYPDLNKPGIHLINHSCTPNAWMYTYKGHTLYFALRHIFAGEEITTSYLLSPLDKYCNPCTHQCRCESIICVKSMHLSKKSYIRWRDFDDKKALETKRQRIRYGRDLPMLTSYPKNIPDNPIYGIFGSVLKTPEIFKEEKLLSNSVIRKLIRKTGKTLEFPKLNKRIIGIQDGTIFSEKIKN